MKRILFALAGLAALLAVGCQRPEQAPVAGAGTSKPAPSPVEPGRAADWKIDLKGPQNLAPNQPAEFQARVTDASGTPVRGANVELTLVMPGHSMPENKVRLTEGDSGVYAGKAVFTMAGDWEVMARAAAQDRAAEQKFNFTVKRP